MTLNMKPQTKELEKFASVLVACGWLAKQKNELGTNHLSSYNIHTDKEIYYFGCVIPFVEMILAYCMFKCIYLKSSKTKRHFPAGRSRANRRTIVFTIFILWILSQATTVQS